VIRLTKADWAIIDEALHYGLRKVNETTYPTYEMKAQQLAALSAAKAKVRERLNLRRFTGA